MLRLSRGFVCCAQPEYTFAALSRVLLGIPAVFRSQSLAVRFTFGKASESKQKRLSQLIVPTGCCAIF